MDRREKGRLGEDAACEELTRRGHEIIARNYRKRCGEVDIISRVGGFIVFTEVKTRSYQGAAYGVEAVDAAKRRKLILTADAYLAEHECALQPRYDIVEVVLARGKNPAVAGVSVYEDAFDTEGVYTGF